MDEKCLMIVGFCRQEGELGALLSLVTGLLSGAQRGLLACMERTGQKLNPMQGPRGEGCQLGMLDRSWLDNFLPSSCLSTG